MIEVFYVTEDEGIQTIEADAGDSVMETAVQNGLEGIVAECGGSLSCATCHVFVGEEWIDKTGTASEEERDMLEGAMTPARPNSRLSCQIVLTEDLNGLLVTVPAEQ